MFKLCLLAAIVATAAGRPTITYQGGAYDNCDNWATAGSSHKDCPHSGANTILSKDVHYGTSDSHGHSEGSVVEINSATLVIDTATFIIGETNTHTPTAYPTSNPTNYPTNYPTTEPTFASKKDWIKAEKKDLKDVASGKVCKGGVVSSLDQYVDCETLVGFLSIVNSNEKDLSKLSKLKHFFDFEDQKHGIEVKYNTKMTHLRLSAKADIGKLIIVDNAKLADIKVSSSTKDVTISGNAKLTKIELDGDADGTVKITKNKVLKTATVKRTIKGGFIVKGNPKVTKISTSDVTGADKEGDSLVIDGTDMLSDAPGLFAIKNLLIGAIKITNNKMLNNLDFLKNIRSIGTDKSGYSLTVRGNRAMNNIMGITKIKGSLGSISIDRNPSLAVLSGFQDVSEVKGDISVTSNKVLHDLLGFGKVKAVKGKLTIKHNDALTTIKCLKNTKSIGSEDISMNKNLKSISKAILAHKDSKMDMTSVYRAPKKSNVLINVGGENTWTSGNCYVGHGSGVKHESTGVMTDGVTESRKGYWHSCRGNGAWAKFRLPYISDIDSVSVWNRADCCEGRIHGATASLVDVDGKEHKCTGTFTNNGRGAKTTVKCPNVAANYVIVRSNGRHHLHFSEVAAAGNRHSTTNLLLNVGNKNTWTSGNCYVGHSSGVKNGATTDILTDGTVDSKKGYWHSCRGSGSWAKFRLADTSSITSVEIFNRGDCCESRINGVTASLVDVDGKEHKCSGTFKNHGRGTPTSVNCDKSVKAAYVLVRGRAGAHLHFSEARAFGTSDATLVRHTSYNGSGKSNICGGATSDDWSTWALYGTSGLTQTVDTSKCGLTQKYPNYVSSMMGRSAHWQLSGVNSLNAIGQKSFAVKVWHPVLRGKFMMFFAKKYKWKLNWLADSGMNSAAKIGGWKLVKGTKNIMYNDVNTKKCGFRSTPRYVTAIHGGNLQFETTGSHAIYQPSKDGFRVYLVVSDNLIKHHKDPVALANKQHWRIAFVASNDKITSGKTTNDWKVYQQDGNELDSKKDKKTTAIYMDVDTSVGAYSTRPAYVTSLSGAGHHWKVTGAGAIYQASTTGFRIYLDNAVSVADAKKFNWRVNYVAYAGATNCLVSRWSKWSYCSKTCGGGFKIRARKIVKRAYFGGSCSHKLYAQVKCSSKACPVDCRVSPWSPKSKCSSTCGAAGVQERTRSVVSAAKVGGRSCPILSEALKCQPGPCAIHCKVSAWKAWNSCPVSCGGKGDATQKRWRKVTSHSLYGGTVCPKLMQERQCGRVACPVNCAMGNWMPFESCSVSCGKGKRMHSRKVETAASNGGKACSTKLKEIRSCNAGPCPVHCEVSKFSEWKACSATCGGGTSKRFRKITSKGNAQGRQCPMLQQAKECNNQKCPVDCVVSNWRKWSKCSATCNGGITKRTRHVNLPKYGEGSKECPHLSEVKSCNVQSCPIDCTMDEWSGWSDCSKTCGRGKTQRDRVILSAAKNGGMKCAKTLEEKPCEAGPCPVKCWVSSWSEWSPCSKSCGVGTRFRERKVTRQAKYKGTRCPVLSQKGSCTRMKCPIDCVTTWDSYSTCSAACTTYKAYGATVFPTKTRKQIIVTKPQHGGKACGPATQSTRCHTKYCDIDCKHSNWNTWSECSTKCNKGFRYRTRTTITKQYGAGKACGALVGKSECNLGACAVHCKTSRWTAWGSCSKKCNSGKQYATRSIITAAKNGVEGFATKCGHLKQTRSCNDQKCPINCKSGAWNPWGICTKTCGGGHRVRVRDYITRSLHGGKKCKDMREKQTCNPQACPRDCKVADWTKWSKCTKTCGTGTQKRSRAVRTTMQNGGKTCPSTKAVRKCSQNKCPVHCTVGSWGAYTKCSTSCGTGSKKATRAILKLPAHGGYTCGALVTIKACNTKACPVDCKVSKWSEWNPFAGSKNQVRRSRTITTKPAFGGKKCPALASTTHHRGVHACKAARVYGDWSKCTKTCGPGYQYRLWEATQCSQTSTLKHHLSMRQGRHCFTRACTSADKDDHTTPDFYVPPLTGKARAEAGLPKSD